MLKGQLKIILSIIREEWHWAIVVLLVLLTVIVRLALSSGSSEELPNDQIGGRPAVPIAELQRFRVNGQESSTAWITQVDDGAYSVTGFLYRSTYKAGLDERGDQTSSKSFLFVPEQVSEITVYHIIPFIEDDDTIYELRRPEMLRGAVSEDLLTYSSMPSPLDGTGASYVSNSDFRLTQLDFRTEDDGDIFASYVGDYWNLSYRYSESSSWLHIIESNLSDGSIYNRTAAERAIANRDTSSPYWLDVSGDKYFELSGIFLSDVTIVEEKYSKVIMLAPLGYSLQKVAHVVPVYFQEQGFVKHLDDLQSDIIVPVLIKDGVLVPYDY